MFYIQQIKILRTLSDHNSRFLEFKTRRSEKEFQRLEIVFKKFRRTSENTENY